MTKKSTTQTPVAIVSLSIDRDLLNRLDNQAEIEDRTRSKMITRMIEFYLDRKHSEALYTNLPKVRLSSIYGECHNKENSPEA